MAIQISYFLTCDQCGMIDEEITTDWWDGSHHTDPAAVAQYEGYDVTNTGHWVCPECEG